jgi:hypothetical protein
VQNCFLVIGVSAFRAIAGALVVIAFVQVLFVPEATSTSEWTTGERHISCFFIRPSLCLGGIAGFVNIRNSGEGSLCVSDVAPFAVDIDACMTVGQ